jgi:hypothetical protein
MHKSHSTINYTCISRSTSCKRRWSSDAYQAEVQQPRAHTAGAIESAATVVRVTLLLFQANNTEMLLCAIGTLLQDNQLDRYEFLTSMLVAQVRLHKMHICDEVINCIPVYQSVSAQAKNSLTEPTSSAYLVRAAATVCSDLLCTAVCQDAHLPLCTI